MTLPNGDIVIGYGNIRWGVPTETLALSVKPVLDAAGRVVRWVQYDLTLKFVVGEENQADGLPTDAWLMDLRAELTRVGLELHYLNVGYGPLQSAPGGEVTFGEPTGSRDVVWGPKPNSFQYKPMGPQSAECVWSVTVCLAPCPETADYGMGMLEWCWRVNYSVDASGYTTRVTRGVVRVAGSRTGPDDRTISDQADRLRERVEPAVLPGFRRGPRTFDLSYDKAALDYSFTDVQVDSPNAPPPRCVQVSASHTASTSKILSLIWVGNLSASYEVAPDAPRGEAYSMFIQLIEERVRKYNNVAFKVPRELAGAGVGARVKHSIVRYIALEASEPEIYGRKGASFRLQYTFLTTLDSLVKTTGLWKPIKQAGGDWAKWSASMGSAAWHVRGAAKLAFSASDDALIDICEEPPVPRDLRAAHPPRREWSPTAGRPARASDDPESSWLFWLSTLRIETTDEVIELKPLPRQEEDENRITGPSGGGGINQPITGPTSGGGYRIVTAPGGGRYPVKTQSFGKPSQPTPPPPGAPDETPIIQRRARPSYYAVLEGYALRATYPIDPPTLREVGGVKAVPCNRPDKGDGVQSGLAAVWLGGTPLHYCSWQLRYLLAGPPAGRTPVMDSPFL